jgi:DNA anti-recombination protein RmuC
MTQPPHDEPTARSQEELRAQVEQTRHELGDTVQELADRADVRTRAREKAAAVREQAGVKAEEWGGQARAKASHVAHTVEEKLPEPVKQKGAAAAQGAKEKAAQAEQVWQDKAPQQLRDHRAALLAGAGALLVACLLIRRRGNC